MFFKKISIFTVLLIFYFQVLGKSLQNDSLLKIFRNQNLPDTTRVIALINYLRTNDHYDNTFKNLLDSAQILINKTTELDSFYIGKYYVVLGLYLFFTDKYDTAQKVLKKAIRCFQRIGNKLYLGISYGNYAHTFCVQGDFGTCIKYLLKAQQIFYDLKDSNLIATGEINLGALYSTFGDDQEAKKRYFKALLIAQKLDNERLTALIYRNLSRIYIKLENFDSALFYLKKAQKIVLKTDYKRLYPDILLIYAKFYLHKNLLDSAFFYLEKALISYKDNNDIYGEIMTYLDFADFYIKKQKYQKAYFYAQKSLSLAEQIEAFDKVRDAYLFLFKLDTLQKNYKSALKNYLLYNKFDDSLKDIQKQIRVVSLELKFALQQKEYENKFLREKEKQQQAIISRQKIILLLAVGLILLLLSFIFYHYRTHKKLKEQNLLLQQQKKQISQQRDILAKQKIEIEASLRYAAVLQQSFLGKMELLDDFFQETFIFYKPKDIVSGDFYWFKKISDDKIMIVVGDCTGHGVHGAMLSIFTITLLNDSFAEISELTAAQTLNLGRQKIKKTLDDIGLDVALIIFDKKNMTINFAGAFRPIYIFHNSELLVFKGDRQPLSNYDIEKPFSDHFINVKSNDMIYLFTDGFSDLISPVHSKFTTGRFKKLLAQIHFLPAHRQFQILEQTFIEWKDNFEQTDDITILGLRV